MFPSHDPFARKSILSVELIKLVEALPKDKIPTTGSEYIQAMGALINILKTLPKMDEYTTSRIARSVYAGSFVSDWGKVLIDDLIEVSADKSKSLDNFRGYFVSDVASVLGCPGEFISMFYCLDKMRVPYAI